MPSSKMKTAFIFFNALQFLLLLHTDIIRGEYTVESADYVEESKHECHYTNGTQKVRYLHRIFYNQEETFYFDSDVGYYIAKTEIGRIHADQFNKDKDFIEDMKARVQTICVYNYDGIHSFTADRRVKPTIKVSLMPTSEDSNSEQQMLMCNVFGFYPPAIEIKWYQNGEEKTAEVQATETYQNGDWTSQILVILETVVNKGDNFSCLVFHESLETPARVDWQPQKSDSAKNKVATGIVGFVLGTVLIIAGVVIYMRGRKAQTLFRGPQTEQFLHS